MKETDSGIQRVDGNGARMNENFVGFERRDFDVVVELEIVGSTERGEENGSAGGDVAGRMCD
jgi:hypothetical protein